MPETFEVYNPKKQVWNTCPICGTRTLYTLRFKYNDEGHMICHSCKDKQIKDIEQADNERRMCNLRKHVRNCSDAELREIIIEILEKQNDNS